MRKNDFAGLLCGVSEAGAIMRGELRPAREIEITPDELAAMRRYKGRKPSPAFAAARVRCIRRRLDLSQAQFAAMLRVPKELIAEWEEGRHAPEGPALALLFLVDRVPQTARQALLAKSA